MRSFEVRCPRMSHGEVMDQRYVHEKSGGQNLSPPLHIDALPPGTRSVAFMLVDRDASDFVHWAVVDVSPGDIRLDEGVSGTAMPKGSRELYNTHASRGYYGPNPPPRSGLHRYELVAYALDVPSLDVDEHADAGSFNMAAREHAIGMDTTYWTYENRS